MYKARSQDKRAEIRHLTVEIYSKKDQQDNRSMNADDTLLQNVSM